MARQAVRDLRDRRFDLPFAIEPGAPELILSPHLDDAVLDCWSVLTSGRATEVVTLFAGVPDEPREPAPWDRICGARDVRTHVLARQAEDREALQLVGVVPIHLSFLDEQYRQGPPPTDFAIAAGVAAKVPAVSRVYGPATVGHGHPDHLLARSVALRLSDAGVPTTLYADLPYAIRFGWPRWVTGTPSDSGVDVDAYWATSLQQLGDRPARPRPVILEHEAAAHKLEGMRRYRTQFPALDGVVLGILSNPAIYRFETFWELGGDSR